MFVDSSIAPALSPKQYRSVLTCFLSLLKMPHNAAEVCSSIWSIVQYFNISKDFEVKISHCLPLPPCSIDLTLSKIIVQPLNYNITACIYKS